ncbi:MAG: hypothetical protein WCX69_03205, partial [Candidatus Paceibacterota bacterium]
MATVYDKISAALKEIRRTQNLIRQGIAKSKEKDLAFKIAREAVELFTDEIFKRKAEKLSGKTFWSVMSVDGFVPASEADDFNEWVALLEEYMESRKIKSEISSEKTHIQSVVDGEDQHIFITQKGSNEHAHLILDGGTGEVRIDPKDKTPHDLVKAVQATLELKTGETIQVTRSSLQFVEPESSHADVRAYTAIKEEYAVLEIYNSGDEDLEDFHIQASWLGKNLLLFGKIGRHEKTLRRFYSDGDSIEESRPRILNILRKGDRTYTRVPPITADRKINIIISCKGV